MVIAALCLHIGDRLVARLSVILPELADAVRNNVVRPDRDATRLPELLSRSVRMQVTVICISPRYKRTLFGHS